MTKTIAPTRYTILRKTPRPKFNCCLKEFPAAEVFPDYKTARAALKARSNAK